jgi:hypothetical protein
MCFRPGFEPDSVKVWQLAVVVDCEVVCVCVCCEDISGGLTGFVGRGTWKA